MADLRQSRLAKPATSREKYAPEKVLEDWKALLRAITKMTEEELEAALRVEVKDRRRKDFIVRLHRRFTRIRKNRELREYLPDEL